VYTPHDATTPLDPLAVVRSLRAGHAFGSSGPMLFLRSGELLPGDTVRTRNPNATFTVRVLAAPWVDVDQVDIYQDGLRVERFAVPASTDAMRFERTFILPVSSARSFVLAVAWGDRPMEAVLPFTNARPFAFTNPIWVERAGR
jgi:hypothetical protein